MGICFRVSRPWNLRSRPAFELATGYALILLVIWTPQPFQRGFFWLAFAWIVGATIVSRRRDDELGFDLRRVRSSLWIVAAVFVVCLVAVGTAEALHLLHPLFGPKPLGMHVWGYLVWALLQQFILQDYFLVRLLHITGSGTQSVVLAGVLFAIAHLPNPVLTVATLVWGVVACYIFLRYRSLYALALAHWMLGLCVAVITPNDVNRHMRVGLGYIRYKAEHGAARAIIPLPVKSPSVTVEERAITRQ